MKPAPWYLKSIWFLCTGICLCLIPIIMLTEHRSNYELVINDRHYQVDHYYIEGRTIHATLRSGSTAEFPVHRTIIIRNHR